MNNWRTTLIGALLATAKFCETYVSNGGDLSDWKLWVFPALIAGLGYLCKDAGVTGSAMSFGTMFIPATFLLVCGTSCTSDQEKLAANGLNLMFTTANAAEQLKIDYDKSREPKLQLTSAKSPKNINP